MYRRPSTSARNPTEALSDIRAKLQDIIDFELLLRQLMMLSVCLYVLREMGQFFDYEAAVNESDFTLESTHRHVPGCGTHSVLKL